MNLDKKKVLSNALEVCEKKIQDLQFEMQTLITDASNDTKSSAGDKHETSRALMQLEQEKLQQQLSILQLYKEELLKIDPNSQHESIRLGSIVMCEKETFFISIPFGRTEFENTTIFLISPQSPLGKALIGKKEKDEVEFNQRTYCIIEVA